ncbi:M23 family metallopeptidase [Candidatus Sumerlaeota bacterium]|nr:M23 family metallopeptidase [Candidatus Sumerlaeota bacterium]
MRHLRAEKISSCVWVLILGATLALYSAVSWAADPVAPSTPIQTLQIPRVQLLGVFEADSSAKALVRFDNASDEFILREGDLVDGFTVRRVEADRVALAQGDKETFVGLANIKRLSPNLRAKTYSMAYDGENSFYPRNTEWSEKAEPAGLAPAPRLKRVAASRPKFEHPMREQGWISSPFGERYRPRTRYYGGGGRQFHTGVDIAAPHGTRVGAAATGTVVGTGWSWDRGRYVRIRHAGGYETRYYHLYRILVRSGQTVKARQSIGLEGNTGNSNGPHLHFEIRKNNVPMDPALFVRSLREVGNRK